MDKLTTAASAAPSTHPCIWPRQRRCLNKPKNDILSTFTKYSNEKNGRKDISLKYYKTSLQNDLTSLNPLCLLLQKLNHLTVLVVFICLFVICRIKLQHSHILCPELINRVWFNPNEVIVLIKSTQTG